mgnify:CR=1 FL=1
MNNSEKMLSAIEAQDLVQAEAWFEKALLEDSDSIGPSRIFRKYRLLFTSQAYL